MLVFQNNKNSQHIVIVKLLLNAFYQLFHHYHLKLSCVMINRRTVKLILDYIEIINVTTMHILLNYFHIQLQLQSKFTFSSLLLQIKPNLV